MPTADRWYESFFTGLFAESVRVIPFPTDAEVAFLVDVLAPPTGGRLLDVPCGEGRLSRPLAARGYRVTGVDLSAELVAAARQQGGTAEYHAADMRQPPAGPFDAAFCFGNSFAYLGREGDAEFLRAVRRSLVPGGRFALHTGVVAESLLPQPLGKRWYELGDLLFLHDSRYDPAAGTLTSDYVILKGERQERKSAVYTIRTFRETLAMFAEAGFRVRETFGTLTREPYRLGSPALYVVAEAA